MLFKKKKIMKQFNNKILKEFKKTIQKLTENKVWCCPDPGTTGTYDCCDDHYEWLCFNTCNPTGGNTMQNGICVGGSPNAEEGDCSGNYVPPGVGPLSADNFEKTAKSNINKPTKFDNPLMGKSTQSYPKLGDLKKIVRESIKKLMDKRISDGQNLI